MCLFVALLQDLRCYHISHTARDGAFSPSLWAAELRSVAVPPAPHVQIIQQDAQRILPQSMPQLLPVPFPRNRRVVEVDRGRPAGLSGTKLRGRVASPTATLRGGGRSFSSSLLPPTGSGNFTISVIQLTPVTQQVEDAFAYASERIRRAVTTELVPREVPSGLRCSSVPEVPLPEHVGNLLLLVQVGPIDGPSNIVGSATSCIFDNDGFVRVGYVEIDSADVAMLLAQNNLESTIIHEALHVMGLGTAWPYRGLVEGYGTASPRYTGLHGNAALTYLNAESYGRAPVQGSGGTGTAGVHWSEDVFSIEMMTPFTEEGASPMSMLTLGALRDIGYSVDFAAADNFTILASSGTVPNTENDPLTASEFIASIILVVVFFCCPLFLCYTCLECVNRDKRALKVLQKELELERERDLFRAQQTKTSHDE